MIKKVLIGALALFVTAGAVNAQTTKFGIKGGFNAATLTDQDGAVSSSKRLPTFHAGLVADLGITEMFSVRTGLDLQSKGIKYNYENSEYTSNPLYLEIPANFTVNLPLGATTDLYVGAGPYVAFGVGGKVKATSGSASIDDKIEFTKDRSIALPFQQYKPIDAGANVIGGVTFNDRFAVNVQYGLGLMNVTPEAANDNKANKHRVFGVGGIFFF